MGMIATFMSHLMLEGGEERGPRFGCRHEDGTVSLSLIGGPQYVNGTPEQLVRWAKDVLAIAEACSEEVAG
jgi:hypothetical protein